MEKIIVSEVSMLTWLKGDLTEQHPHVREVILTLDGTSHVVLERDRNESSAGVDVVQHRTKRHGCRLPVQVRAEITHHLLEDLHSLREHVVAVHLK